MQDASNDSGFPAINIETRRQHDEFRAALQRHVGRHGGAHAELSRFIITGREDPAPIAGAAHSDWFAAQLRAIAHFDRGIKAIHIQMDDGAFLDGAAHMLKPTPDARTRKSRPARALTTSALL